MPRPAFAATSRAPRAAVLSRLLEAARKIWTRLQRERRLRATIRTLHGLNDRTLKDVGLRRGDIEAVVRDRCRTR